MAIPWVQIVQWVPSILEVSRQLLQEARKRPAAPRAPLTGQEQPDELAARVASLEDNEQRQMELVHRMAEHLGELTQAMTAQKRLLRWMVVANALLAAAVVALAVLR